MDVIDLKLSSKWMVRVNQNCYGNRVVDFAQKFTYPYLCIWGETTNYNPGNRLGIFTHTLSIPLLGGVCELEGFTFLNNKIPRIIQIPLLSNNYGMRFKFAAPVGNCTIKIWEYQG
jgi:hypothetical protein